MFVRQRAFCNVLRKGACQSSAALRCLGTAFATAVQIVEACCMAAFHCSSHLSGLALIHRSIPPGFLCGAHCLVPTLLVSTSQYSPPRCPLWSASTASCLR